MASSLANLAIDDDDETRARSPQSILPWRFEAATAAPADDDDDLAETQDANPTIIARSLKAPAPKEPRSAVPPWRTRAPSAGDAEAPSPGKRKKLVLDMKARERGERNKNSARADSASKLHRLDRTENTVPLDTEVDEKAPDSGVRPSVTSPILGPQRPAAKGDSDNLTVEKSLSFSVYTISDLEQRGDLRAPRVSLAFAEPPTTRLPATWRVVGVSALVFLRALRGWARSPKPRPRLLDVLRFPLQTFSEDLRVALRGVAWRRVGIAAAFGAASLAVLLFAVLTAAELTDDLKPRRAGLAPTPAAAETAKPAMVADAPPAATLELDEEPPVADDLPATPTDVAPSAPPLSAAAPHPPPAPHAPVAKAKSARFVVPFVPKAAAPTAPAAAPKATTTAPAASAPVAAPPVAAPPPAAPKAPAAKGGKVRAKSDDLKSLLN